MSNQNVNTTEERSKLSANKIKNVLTKYESLFPDKALQPLSFALIGDPSGAKLQFSEDEATVNSTFENVIKGIEKELNDENQTSDDFSKIKQYAPKWADLCHTLSTLTDKSEPIKYDLRQYDTTDETAAEINEMGTNDCFGLLAHSGKITGVGTLIAYQLQNDEYAVIINREQRTGTFSVKYSNRYYGSFEVFFTEDVESLVETELHSDDWYRPQDIKSNTNSPSDNKSTV